MLLRLIQRRVPRLVKIPFNTNVALLLTVIRAPGITVTLPLKVVVLKFTTALLRISTPTPKVPESDSSATMSNRPTPVTAVLPPIWSG